MHKLHWISLALIASPFALMGACGGDDTAAGGAGGSAGTTTTTGAAGHAGATTTTTVGAGGMAGSGSGTAGQAGTNSAGGAAGTATGAGGATGGAAGTAGGGAGAATDGGGAGAKVDSGGGVPACTSTTPTSPAMSAADFCAILAATCKDANTLPAYNTEAKCAAAFGASTKMICQSYHLCNATKGDAATHCQHAQQMGGQCGN